MTETTLTKAPAQAANLTLDVLDASGAKVDTVDLPAEIFAV